ncbi:MAG: ribonuclease HI [Lactobacillaceae bacterium]|jgi:ribonuclease HI|nr:ribonuclease HI [Lactobacillaceae bacterium]
MNKTLKIYSDGGNRNTGVQKGGHVNANDLSAWAYLIEFEGQQFSDSGFEYGQTNNAMEVTALLEAFRRVGRVDNDVKVELILDSKYVLDSLEKGWAENWILKNDTKRPNFNLWKQLVPIYVSMKSQIDFIWVKGHASTPGNLFVDELLNKEMDAH